MAIKAKSTEQTEEVSQRNILAAIRELAAATPQHGNVDMSKRIEEILSAEGVGGASIETP